MDASARVRARDAALYDSPEARASLLRQRLRSEPLCETCGGVGHALRGGNVSDEVQRAAAKPCSRCAGTGSRLKARIELAAYCGDLGALAALCCPHDDIRDGDRGCICYYARPETPFAAWVARLSRWADVGRCEGWVLVRASLAAAEQALAIPSPERHPNGEPALDPALHAVIAARRWSMRPDDPASLVVWRVVCNTDHLPLWAPTPAVMRMEANGERNRSASEAIRSSAEAAGEHPVREAISSSLIRWALSEEP